MRLFVNFVQFTWLIGSMLSQDRGGGGCRKADYQQNREYNPIPCLGPASPFQPWRFT